MRLLRNGGLLRRKLGRLLRGNTDESCCCDPLIDWIEIVNVCDSEDVYYLTLEECAAMTPDCDTTILTYDGKCYEAGAAHYGEPVGEIPHFPGEIGECADPGCYDLILSFQAEETTCGLPLLDGLIRVSGTLYPGYFELDGCDTTLAPWEGKIGIICPATVDPEPCCLEPPGGAGCECFQEFAEEWGAVKSPRYAYFVGLVDIICKDAPDPDGVGVIDPDDFTWYDAGDFPPYLVGFTNCCYASAPPEVECVCDQL